MFLASTAAGATAHGKEVEPIRIDFHAHEGCPDEATFFRQVQARTSRARRVAAGEASRMFTVRLAPGGEGTRGKLSVRDVDGSTEEREIAGRTCDEVVAGLGLIVAIAIDPAAARGAIPLRGGELVEGPRDDAPRAAPSPPVPAASAGAAPDHGNDSAARARPPLVHGASAPSNPWFATAGVQATLLSGIMPESSVVWAPHATIGVARGSLVPALRLLYMHLDGAPISTSLGEATLRLRAARVEGCVGVPARSGRLLLLPCAALGAGVMLAEGEGALVVEPRSVTRPWLAVGAGARAGWAAWGPLHLEAEVALGAPLVRDTFSFRPAPSVHRVAPVWTEATAGVSVRFL